MPNENQLPFADGLSIFAHGRYWPIGLVNFGMFEARILVPDALPLTYYDQVAIKFGSMPSFPALVQSIDRDIIELEFLCSAHPMVVAKLNQDCDKSQRWRPLGALLAA